MVKFIPVRYARTNYPEDIRPKIQEVPFNFGRVTLENSNCLPYLSLHTDPSIIWYGSKRNKILSSDILKEFPLIRSNILDFGHAKLWCDQKWSKEFAGFLTRLTEGIDHQRIRIIEVHTPFNTSCDLLEDFIDIYKTFEEEVLKEFPSAEILIENMFNNDRKKRFGKFILSTSKDIIKLSDLISESNLKLRLVLDIPQLLSEHNGGNKLLTEGMIKDTLAPFMEMRNYIKSTHIWGNDINKIRGAHSCDFNTYFDGDEELKKCFLEEIRQLFDDGKARYFVPEVGSTIAVQSIVNDLKNAGIQFVDPE